MCSLKNPPASAVGSVKAEQAESLKGLDLEKRKVELARLQAELSGFQQPHIPTAEESKGVSLGPQTAPRRQGLGALDINEIFRYHAPTPDQIPKYEAIREAARVFALVILENTPSSPDQTAAIRLLRECTMTANSSLALGGKY